MSYLSSGSPEVAFGEMVLLKPVNTDNDAYIPNGQMRYKILNEQLEQYNRWLRFVNPSRPGREVRNAGKLMQRSIHDLNAIVANMVLELDSKLGEIQDHTAAFIDTIKAGGYWEKDGDLLGK
jgi:hypothetical protein